MDGLMFEGERLQLAQIEQSRERCRKTVRDIQKSWSDQYITFWIIAGTNVLLLALALFLPVWGIYSWVLLIWSTSDLVRSVPWLHRMRTSLRQAELVLRMAELGQYSEMAEYELKGTEH